MRLFTFRRVWACVCYICSLLNIFSLFVFFPCLFRIIIVFFSCWCFWFWILRCFNVSMFMNFSVARQFWFSVSGQNNSKFVPLLCCFSFSAPFSLAFLLLVVNNSRFHINSYTGTHTHTHTGQKQRQFHSDKIYLFCFCYSVWPWFNSLSNTTCVRPVDATHIVVCWTNIKTKTQNKRFRREHKDWDELDFIIFFEIDSIIY